MILETVFWKGSKLTQKQAALDMVANILGKPRVMLGSETYASLRST